MKKNCFAPEKSQDFLLSVLARTLQRTIKHLTIISGWCVIKKKPFICRNILLVGSASHKNLEKNCFLTYFNFITSKRERFTVWIGELCWSWRSYFKELFRFVYLSFGDKEFFLGIKTQLDAWEELAIIFWFQTFNCNAVYFWDGKSNICRSDKILFFSYGMLSLKTKLYKLFSAANLHNQLGSDKT